MALGGSSGNCRVYKRARVLQLWHDHPLTHPQSLVVKSCPKVVAQDVGVARLVGAQPAVCDLRPALGRAVLQAQARELAQPRSAAAARPAPRAPWPRRCG